MENISTVVESKACSGCGMCVAACPVNAISLTEHSIPAVADDCTECGICVEMCPRTEMPYTAIEGELARKKGADRHDPLIGCYTHICLEQVLNDAIRNRSYWGGATTALLAYLFEQGHIDAALLTDKAHDLFYCSHAKPRVAASPADAVACAFTKPTVTPQLARLPVAGRSIAVVGTSCHLEAIRKAQYLAENGTVAKKRCRELTGNITFLLGLNCFFANTYTGVDQQLQRLGLQEKDIKRFFYATGIPSVELFDGTIKEIPEGNTNFSALNLGCLLCYPSYTARLSDVTFGKTMSEEWGWNDVICRSKKIAGLLQEMEGRGIIETRTPVDGGTEMLESLLEAQVFSVDAMGYATFVETGSFSPDEAATAMLNRPGGTITGTNRLRLIQAVRKYSFYEPAVAARKAKGVFVPVLT
ncbi:MAG: Coenzyme F420 hydrogenase/dehydrogenase, beta subunit C-terminal domain [Proteobacteria bacterium]|nr:Coenzyme F420 hydrogenase/dehydrogenase, beta subunit C-terminal domain [Pseudomonadota bacterium]